jgi:hypothetical protein
MPNVIVTPTGAFVRYATPQDFTDARDADPYHGRWIDAEGREARLATTFVFNNTICTTPGLTYHTETISVEHARQLIEGVELTSAIGHAGTAAIAATLLGRPELATVSRIAAHMLAGDTALCVKLRGRPPEGVILSAEEVEAIGYDLVLMRATDPRSVEEHVWRLTECDPDFRPRPERLETSVPGLIHLYELSRAEAHRLDLESGRHYAAQLPLDNLRAGFARLCITTIEECIAARRDDLEPGALSAKLLNGVREQLVDRLVDVLQHRGMQVS